jgi:hypothetical protein
MGLVRRENLSFFHISALAAIIAFGMLEMTAVSTAADNKESKEKQKTYVFIHRGKPTFTIPIPVEFRKEAPAGYNVFSARAQGSTLSISVSKLGENPDLSQAAQGYLAALIQIGDGRAELMKETRTKLPDKTPAVEFVIEWFTKGDVALTTQALTVYKDGYSIAIGTHTWDKNMPDREILYGFNFKPVLSEEAEASDLPATTEGPYSPPVRDKYPNNVYWGDTHLHTNLSGDAVFNLGPDEAYRFARGEEVTSNTGQKVKLRRPLDFIVIADHGNNMGAELTRNKVRDDPSFRNTKVGKLWAQQVEELLKSGVSENRLKYGKFWPGNPRNIAFRRPGFRQSIWERVTAGADRHNTPGQFTAFIGYEWTSALNQVHRVVIFKDGADIVNKVLPFTSYDSMRPERLWEYLDEYQKSTGGSVLAIPHNSNLTYGAMFAVKDTSYKPLSKEYATTRSGWEPLVEVTQIKGDSETHPFLSPDDEFADFETWNGWAGRENGAVMWTGVRVRMRPDSLIQYEYARSALKLGLQQQAKIGANPFKFGMIGSTDSHTGLVAVDENNFWGKTMVAEPSASRVEARYAIMNWEMSAAGYAAVWATENTREALFDAMRRKEVYASTGPRMIVRFFGGWDYVSDDALRPDLARIGYTKGVPMGGDLTKRPEGISPTFLIGAVKDPDGANLDRVQVIKGWFDKNSVLHEKVYNVALSDDRKEDRNGKVKPVGNTVDVKNASYTNSIGDPELVVVWTDPDFDKDELAFYYVRVLEIPTPRWTAYDAKFYGLRDLSDDIPMITQERAYTSPIWYTP